MSSVPSSARKQSFRGFPQTTSMPFPYEKLSRRSSSSPLIHTSSKLSFNFSQLVTSFWVGSKGILRTGMRRTRQTNIGLIKVQCGVKEVGCCAMCFINNFCSMEDIALLVFCHNIGKITQKQVITVFSIMDIFTRVTTTLAGVRSPCIIWCACALRGHWTFSSIFPEHLQVH